jgi:hypothetical protein
MQCDSDAPEFVLLGPYSQPLDHRNVHQQSIFQQSA